MLTFWNHVEISLLKQEASPFPEAGAVPMLPAATATAPNFLFSPYFLIAQTPNLLKLDCQFMYCAFLNFPLLISLSKAPLRSKPQLVPQPDALTFLSSAVTEEPFLILKSSCRDPSADPQEQPCLCRNTTSPCFSAFCTLDYF